MHLNIQTAYFVICFRIFSKTMKKLVYILLLALVGGLIFTSCKSNENCAAYGEAKNFKVERRK